MLTCIRTHIHTHTQYSHALLFILILILSTHTHFYSHLYSYSYSVLVLILKYKISLSTQVKHNFLTCTFTHTFLYLYSYLVVIILIVLFHSLGFIKFFSACSILTTILYYTYKSKSFFIYIFIYPQGLQLSALASNFLCATFDWQKFIFEISNLVDTVEPAKIIIKRIFLSLGRNVCKFHSHMRICAFDCVPMCNYFKLPFDYCRLRYFGILQTIFQALSQHFSPALTLHTYTHLYIYVYITAYVQLILTSCFAHLARLRLRLYCLLCCQLSTAKCQLSVMQKLRWNKIQRRKKKNKTKI